jgi:glycosyltransferase involved in cell wall biosynthesis
VRSRSSAQHMQTVVSVLAVQPLRIGGTETFARELSLQLGQRGWKSVLCFDSKPPEEVARFLDLPNVSLEILENSTHFNLSATRKLATLLRRHKPDILHLHYTGFVGLFPWLARLSSVKKVFFTDHSSRPANHTPRRAPFLKRALVRLINYPITRVVCVSKYGCHCMRTLDLLGSDRYELVYNGVDLTRVESNPARGVEFRRRFGVPDCRKVIVQISWIIPQKGIPDLLEVAKIVVARDQNAHFIIVGEGPYREQYMKQAREMGLDDNVTWTGLITDPFGEGVFDAADVVCQFSHWEELFGWMIAEAMAYKKPIVATRVGGIPELVADGESGYLVARDDPTAAAEKLQSLLRDSDLRHKMGLEGCRRVHTKFNLRQNVQQLVRTYKL